MKRLFWLMVSSAVLWWGCPPGVQNPPVTGPTFMPSRVPMPPTAKLVSDGGRLAVDGPLARVRSALHPKHGLVISLELPRGEELGAAGVVVEGSESEEPVSLVALENATERLATTFPPGPDNGTIWRTFQLPLSAASDLEGARFRATAELSRDLDFTRVLVGVPSTPGSYIVGAFADEPLLRDPRTIAAGVDYLGTDEAIQHLRIPAGALLPGTKAFDGMVSFTEAPFDGDRFNVDTLMMRPEGIRVGDTVPVRLLRFANRTVEPIRIASGDGDLFFEITATLSPNAYSGGFITILPDGTYRSTTSLTPVMSFQRVVEGDPVGQPIVVDSAKVPVSGFPFYLASDGGRWREEPPSGRLVTTETSNFFYDNGPINQFFHSNGLGDGVLAACKKKSAVLQ
ncbi:MAG: hypothetical protein AAF481_15645 [Acidobacteriota bacterium]